MTWNYRVVREVITDAAGQQEDSYTIREVYYNDGGTYAAYSANPCFPQGETQEELMEDLRLFQEAFGKPTIDLNGLDKACTGFGYGKAAPEDYGDNPSKHASEDEEC